MRYEAEFRFFLNLLKNMDIPVRIFPISDENKFKKELDVYFLLNPDFSYSQVLNSITRVCRPNCIYRAYDLFCNYLLFQLPETEQNSYVLIGPYSQIPANEKNILETVNHFSVPPAVYPLLKDFYSNLKLVTDENHLLTTLNTLGTVLWQDLNNFTWNDIDSKSEFIFPSVPENIFSSGECSEYEEPSVIIKRIEENYQTEEAFLTAVSLGQTHKAQMLMNDYTITRIEHRFADPIRNIKNYTFTINTLLRKAVEAGGVHPIHIDRISSAYAKKIELITSPDSAIRLHREMVHKYCILVKNHSLKSYSPLIKKVITYIDADLTADLSLKALSALLNINASYLSSLFKKEMNITLTEYVNKNRISHAVMLLNTTDMQIQLIAQYCGIPDVNYFTKTFKKFIGKTPQEYRRNISRSANKV